eukprot:TRINITY_DN39228_c0_g1_i1.p1 TRINITY_DN39228_c0_g1~~TRINITY_DN39228_c0_g1_i1.p1  ORF type:complete len:338 (+),score=23.16 TRINITY_DN39228_c0_g1_i1:60-1073(+)
MTGCVGCSGLVMRLILLLAMCLFDQVVGVSGFCSSAQNEGGLTLVVARMLGLCVSPSSQEQREPLKVFVAGLSKTGTSSMKLALEQLGYKPYHMSELSTSSQLPVWVEAARNGLPGKRGNASLIFDALSAAGYNATTDVPMSFFWREALQRYPHAKFILTVRDTPVHYARSWESMMWAAGNIVEGVFRLVPFFALFRETVEWWATLYPGLTVEQGRAWVLHWEPWRRLTMSQGELDLLRQNGIRSYIKHNEDVQQGIPADRLLVFNVKQGFSDGKLCAFLDIPHSKCPAVFPHSNEGTIIKPLGVVLILFRFSWVYLPFLLVLFWVKRSKRQRCKVE